MWQRGPRVGQYNAVAAPAAAANPLSAAAGAQAPAAGGALQQVSGWMSQRPERPEGYGGGWLRSQPMRDWWSNRPQIDWRAARSHWLRRGQHPNKPGDSTPTWPPTPTNDV